MMKSAFFRSTVVILGLLLQFNVWAQTAHILHVETAGTLPALIADNEKYEITDLTLTGDLNGTDIRFIREMAGRTVNGGTTSGKLSVLNLSGANIVSGGDYYYVSSSNVYRTANNVISTNMFYQCNKLTNVILPNSVTLIGMEAFYGCTGLTSITIGNSVTSIGNHAFYGCTGLKSVTIPNSVTSIGDGSYTERGVFQGCTGLTSVTIGNGVTRIRERTFYGCTGLTSITIGNSVIWIVHDAFSGCTKLKEFIVSAQNQNYSVIDGVLCNKDKTSILIFPQGKSSTYTIPASVTSIGGYAFYGCTGLTSVTIGNSVTSIGDGAFYGCTGLTEIHSKNPKPPIIYYSNGSHNSFYNVNNNICTLYVPKGSKSAYQSAEGWNAFSNIIETNF